MKVIELHESVTESNDKDAEFLRNELTEKGIKLINVMSSPGAGKTTLLSRIIKDAPDPGAIAVIEADIDSDVDALSIGSLGVQAVQVHTDGMCHMDAGMTRTGIEALDLTGVNTIFLENVGNLICPAEFDTGAHFNLMILSVPEGDDKPLKYPLMFKESDILAVTKTDALPAFDFDMDAFTERVLKLNPNIKIFPVSAKTGNGMNELIECLLN